MIHLGEKKEKSDSIARKAAIKTDLICANLQNRIPKYFTNPALLFETFLVASSGVLMSVLTILVVDLRSLYTTGREHTSANLIIFLFSFGSIGNRSVWAVE